MKRSKMIFSAFAVAAVVTASLAFTSKPYGQSYCVKTGLAGTCTNFLTNQKPDGNGTLYRSVEIKLLDE